MKRSAYVRLHHKICGESEFMMFSDEDDCFNEVDIKSDLAIVLEQLSKKNSTVFVAVNCSETLVGFISIKGGTFARNRHRADLTMGVVAEFRGQGIATRLMLAVEDWAQTVGVSRLELSVVEDNTRALSLYLKLGYVIEGQKQKAIRVYSRYLNGIFMAKLLPGVDVSAISIL